MPAALRIIAGLTFKLLATEDLAPAAASEGVLSLDHGFRNDRMKDFVLEVPALRVADEVLDRQRRLLREQPDVLEHNVNRCFVNEGRWACALRCSEGGDCLFFSCRSFVEGDLVVTRLVPYGQPSTFPI